MLAGFNRKRYNNVDTGTIISNARHHVRIISVVILICAHYGDCRGLEYITNRKRRHNTPQYITSIKRRPQIPNSVSIFRSAITFCFLSVLFENEKMPSIIHAGIFYAWHIEDVSDYVTISISLLSLCFYRSLRVVSELTIDRNSCKLINFVFSCIGSSYTFLLSLLLLLFSLFLFVIPDHIPVIFIQHDILLCFALSANRIVLLVPTEGYMPRYRFLLIPSMSIVDKR